MTRGYHATANNLVPTKEPSVLFSEHVAKECLNRIASPKEWASALSVTDRQVRRWAQGDQDIPPLREAQILRQAKTFLMAHRLIEDSIDRALLATYGRKESM